MLWGMLSFAPDARRVVALAQMLWLTWDFNKLWQR
jgi:hypothetical protein